MSNDTTTFLPGSKIGLAVLAALGIDTTDVASVSILLSATTAEVVIVREVWNDELNELGSIVSQYDLVEKG